MATYIKYSHPNVPELTQSLRVMRGGRSMAQFAHEIKESEPDARISAATLSRAENPNFLQARSHALIEAIYRHRDPACADMSLSQVMLQNGMKEIPVPDPGNAYIKSIHDEKKSAIRFQIKATLRELLKDVTDHTTLPNRERLFELGHDFAFSYNDADSDTKVTWEFWLHDSLSPQPNFLKRFTSRYAPLFSAAALEQAYDKEAKASIVMIDPALYRAVKEAFSHVDTNGYISIILIDTLYWRIKKEDLLGLNTKRYSETMNSERLAMIDQA